MSLVQPDQWHTQQQSEVSYPCHVKEDLLRTQHISHSANVGGCTVA